MQSLPPFIDIEASGFGRGSYPIEVGFVLEPSTTYCSLILPAPHWTHWDAAAEQVHHISRTVLQAHGRPATVVAQSLNAALQGQTVYSDGWAHDYSWLGILFDEAGLMPTFKLENLRKLLSEDEAARWDPCKQGVIAELGEPRHRASTDARVLQQTLGRLRAA
jgi:hypothetical protein